MPCNLKDMPTRSLEGPSIFTCRTCGRRPLRLSSGHLVKLFVSIAQYFTPNSTKRHINTPASQQLVPSSRPRSLVYRGEFHKSQHRVISVSFTRRCWICSKSLNHRWNWAENEIQRRVVLLVSPTIQRSASDITTTDPLFRCGGRDQASLGNLHSDYVTSNPFT